MFIKWLDQKVQIGSIISPDGEDAFEVAEILDVKFNIEDSQIEEVDITVRDTSGQRRYISTNGETREGF